MGLEKKDEWGDGLEAESIVGTDGQLGGRNEKTDILENWCYE